MNSLFDLLRPLAPPLAAVILALPAAGALHAQGPGELPANRTTEFVTAVGQIQIADAIRTGLNSPGDELALYIEGGLSIGIGANTGIDVGIEAVARRLGSGGVEVAIGYEIAQSVGIEAFEGLECNASMGGGQTVLFVWPTAQGAARGLDLLAGGHQLAMSSFVDTFENVFDTLRYAHGALREAINSTALAQGLYKLQAKAYDSAAADFRALQRDASKARRHLSKIRSRVRAAQRKVRRLPRWLRGVARAVLRTVSRSLSRNGVLYRGISITLSAAELAATVAYHGCRAKRAALDHAYRDEDSARRMVESAEAVAESVDDLFLALGSVSDELMLNLAGVEFSLTGAAEVSAAIGPAGISMENVGAGVSGSQSLTARIGYRVLDRGVESLAVALIYDVEGTAWAGAGVGVRSEIGYGLEIESEWLREPARGGYEFHDVVTSIGADVAVMAVVGAGVAVRHGLGEHVALSLNAAQWDQASRALAAMNGGMNATDLSLALQGVSCDVEFGMRRITQMVAGLGGSYAGTGIHFEMGATWNDQGEPLIETLNAGQIVEMIGSAAWGQGAADRLSARL